MMAGAVGEEIEAVAHRLVERGTVRVDVAQDVLADLRGS